MTDFWATDSKRILISYCERDHENTGFIAGLVSDLNREGFCVVWDHGNSAPDDWPKWFRDNAKNADFVLVVFSENFTKCWDDTVGYGSGGIVEEVAYLKDNLKGEEKDIENWRVIPVFRTGEKNRFKLAKLREAVRPKGFLGSGNTFGLRAQQTQLIRYLRREKPPIDYGRFGKFGWLGSPTSITTVFQASLKLQLKKAKRKLSTTFQSMKVCSPNLRKHLMRMQS